MRVMRFSPGGAFENSPAFQRWEQTVAIRPEGTVEALGESAVPPGLNLVSFHPALKRRAILIKSLRDKDACAPG